MIVVTRTISVAPGKTASAIGVAKQIAAYMKTSTGTDVEVLMPIGGNPFRITWTSRYPDLAEFEVRWAKISADQKYLQLVTSGLDNFVPGSVFDTLWRVI